ncbi:hypothetical protein RHA1_ro03259 [Rhodococcus jostii RHA1]|uniref:Uncharacterized protein n=1 Tax=Rhodococcus jostii (strain RHA1) TaxID=101510 RepID=Q0SBM4_RHOJR|nr:hypothetical protein RHA1_ro03259 [Rhodococcus jostii RHA1]
MWCSCLAGTANTLSVVGVASVCPRPVMGKRALTTPGTAGARSICGAARRPAGSPPRCSRWCGAAGVFTRQALRWSGASERSRLHQFRPVAAAAATELRGSRRREHAVSPSAAAKDGCRRDSATMPTPPGTASDHVHPGFPRRALRRPLGCRCEMCVRIGGRLRGIDVFDPLTGTAAYARVVSLGA